jgi:succinate dehydrogenase flavin-adding protein (antitoxin of CptAB toxin-antitoxin module)
VAIREKLAPKRGEREQDLIFDFFFAKKNQKSNLALSERFFLTIFFELKSNEIKTLVLLKSSGQEQENRVFLKILQ